MTNFERPRREFVQAVLRKDLADNSPYSGDHLARTLRHSVTRSCGMRPAGSRWATAESALRLLEWKPDADCLFQPPIGQANWRVDRSLAWLEGTDVGFELIRHGSCDVGTESGEGQTRGIYNADRLPS
jgi:hypothetical protein